MAWSNGSIRRKVSVIVSVCMIVQMFLQAFLPLMASANEATATSVTPDKRIAFKVAKSTLDIKVKLKSGTLIPLDDADNDGTFTGKITGQTAAATVEYKYNINGVDMIDLKDAAAGNGFLTATATAAGEVALSFTPKVSVLGSFNANWASSPMVYNSSTRVHEFTTPVLRDGLYEYQYLVEQTGATNVSVYIKDSVNPLSNGAKSQIWVGTPIAADSFLEQSGALNTWIVAGDFQGWNIDSLETKMTHLVGGYYVLSKVIPAGKYNFKFAKYSTWAGSVGNGTNNFVLTLTETQKVNFYLKEVAKDKDPIVRISVAGVVGLPQYVPAVTAAKTPRLIGDFQATLFTGELNDSAATAKQFFVDYNFDNTVYKIQRNFPVGKFNAKISFGSDGLEVYGATGSASAALSVNVLDPSPVVFTFDNTSATSRKLTTDYKANDSLFDGQIKKDRILFDSRSKTFKSPFGAIAEKQSDVTFRIAADKDDVQMSKLELSDGEKIYSFDMKKVATVPDVNPAPGTSGARDYFEVTIPKDKFNKVAVWSYKFILVDGSSKVEYGDDASRGGTGIVADEGALPYDLTVYRADFKTPDWMKGAVVYQIFPDRFFDGNKANNRAKIVDGSRGERTGTASSPIIKNTMLQFFDGGVPNDPTPDLVWGNWSVVPENPNRVSLENKPYFPTAKSDLTWGNEFYGGDIQGIQQKLDYLKTLGVTVIYLNPVAWAASNHKYDATDYSHLDPMFGEPVYKKAGDPKSGLDYDRTRQASDAVFKAFAKAAREKGIKLFVDGVFNHVGDDSIYFDRYEKYPEIGAYEYWDRVWEKVEAGATQTAAEQEVRAYYTSLTNPATGQKYRYPEDFKFTTMFTVQKEKTKWGYRKFDAWWGFDSLPNMDAVAKQANDPNGIEGVHEYNNIEYRKLIVGENLQGKSSAEKLNLMQETVSQRWNWMGARGWRLDVAPEVSDATWVKFREAVRSTEGLKDDNGDTIETPLLLAEEWGVASKYLLGDTFDSVMNYRFRRALQSFLMDYSYTGNQLHEELESIREDYPAEAWNVMLNLVSSHDVPRHITKLDNPKWEDETVKIAPDATDRALKLQGLTAIFQMGYPGAPTVYYGDEVGLEGTRDPDSRRAFPWEERITQTGNTYNGKGKYQEVFNTFRKAASVRNQFDLFQNGELKMVFADNNVLAYARKDNRLNGKAGLVIVNKTGTDKVISADVAGFLPDGLIMKDQLNGTFSATVRDGKVVMSVPAYGGYMMVSEQSIPTLNAVTISEVTASGNAATVKWNAQVGVEKYNVWRSLLKGGELTKIGSINATSGATSYTDLNLSYGTTYYYTVTAATGAAESVPAPLVGITPTYGIESVKVGAVTPITVGVGKTASEILVTIEASGLNAQEFAGKAFPNAITQMAYFLKKESNTEAELNELRLNPSVTKLRYRKDETASKEGNIAKVYAATIEPYAAGTFHLFGKVELGNIAKTSPEVPLTVNASADVTAPTTAPVLQDLNVESNKVQLKWEAVVATDLTGYEIWRKKVGNATEPAELLYQRIAVVDSKTLNYVDYLVSNDVTYSYQIAAFDTSYNRSISVAKAVTPKLIMVDVTIRVNLPSYTPETDDIFIAGSGNNWNASGWKLAIPNGKSGRDVLEYNFKMMAGKEIEYKYTRGTWDTEAFTSHTRIPNDTIDPGNWFYSDFDTNMKLKVLNQKDGKMIVNDYIIGYVDMPMIVSTPRKYLGGGNDKFEFETEDKTVRLKAKVPFGVNFTVNGAPIAPSEMDEQGNVDIPSIPLTAQRNEFALRIEPSEATKKQPWFKSADRAKQATKTITMIVTNPNFPVFNSALVATSVGNKVSLKWTKPVSTSPITSYVVYVGKTIVDTLPATETTYEISGLRAGIANEFRVEAVNAREFSGSATTTYTIPTKTSPTPTVKPNQQTPRPMTTATQRPSATERPIPTSIGETDIPVMILPSQIDEQVDSRGNKKYVAMVDENELMQTFQQQAERREQHVVVSLQGEDAAIQNNLNLVLPASQVNTIANIYSRPNIQLLSDALGFQLPLRDLNLAAQAERYGVGLDDMQVVITVRKVSDSIMKQIKAKVAAQNGSLVSIPFEFKVFLLINDRLIALDKMSEKMIERTVYITKPISRSRVTGITVDAKTGELTYVPTSFYADGSRTASIMSYPVNGIFMLAQFSRTYSDLNSHWAKTDLQFMLNKLMISPLNSKRFGPDQVITRDQFAKALVQVLGLPTVQPNDKFRDLPSTSRTATFGYTVEAYGLMNGCKDDSFCPGATMSRLEVAVALSRALELKGIVGEPDLATDRLLINGFSDRAGIPTGNISAVANVIREGIMLGTSPKLFEPRGKVTRAQATLLLRRLSETLGYLQR